MGLIFSVFVACSIVILVVWFLVYSSKFFLVFFYGGGGGGGPLSFSLSTLRTPPWKILLNTNCCASCNLLFLSFFLCM